MKPTALLTQKSDFLDIIFLNKNKAYGAYFLRRIYPSHLKRSLMLGVLFFAFLLSLPMLINALSPDEIVKEKISSTVILQHYDIKKPEEKKPLEQKQVKQKSTKPPTQKFTTLLITKDPDVSEKPPVINQLSANAGIEDVKSDITTYVTQESPKIQDPILTTEPDKIFEYAEEEPTFPGGQDALMKYLAKTRFPEMARRNGITGKVIIRFVVNKIGQIEDIHVVRSIHPLLDQTAIESVKNMPLWNPGKHKGKAVSVMYTLPFNFTIKD